MTTRSARTRTVTKTTNGSAEQGKRLHTLHDERAHCQETIETVLRQAHGATGPERKTAARALTEARAELAMLDDEIAALEAALPDLVQAEGHEAAAQWLHAAESAYRADLATLDTLRQTSRATGDQHVAAVQAEGAFRRSLRQRDLGRQVLQVRYPDLFAGAAALPMLPPLDDYALPVVNAVNEAGAPGRSLRLTVPRGASDTPEQVQRAAWKALATWLDRHAGSLPEDVRAVFALAGVPAWETAAERSKRETEAAEKAEDTRRMLAGLEGERARSQVRHAL